MNAGLKKSCILSLVYAIYFIRSFLRFDSLVFYGKTLLKQNLKADKIRDNVVDLQSEYQTLVDIWKRRDKELHEDLSLLVRNLVFFLRVLVKMLQDVVG